MGTEGRRRPEFITKRAGIRLTRLLLSGAVVNVAMAWGCVIGHGTVQQEWSPHQYPNDQLPDFVFFVTSRFGYQIVSGCERSGTLLGRHADRVRIHDAAIWWPLDAVSGFGIHESHGAAGGWPNLSMMTWTTSDLTDNAAGDGLEIHQHSHGGYFLGHDQSIPLGDLGTVACILPLRPIWPGFAINTVFYAAILWLLFAAPFAWRWRRRIQRGLCPKCAYDMRGRAVDATVCPECGAVQPLAVKCRSIPKERAS